MNLTSPNFVRQVLDELDLRPGKSMGQNFLIDANILAIILTAAELEPDNRVLEIGPGLGVLTQELLARTAHVVAIEKDRKLHQFLQDKISADSNLELLCADALDVDLAGILAAGADKVVANLPYSVASRILVELFKAGVRASLIVVTLQQDVAERIAAPVGGREYGLLAILAQRFYQVEIVKEIGPNCFLPRPRVGSALLVCRRREEALAEVVDDEFFLRVVKMTFTHRRKVIVNALRGAGFELEPVVKALCAAAIDERRRPAELTIADWGRLSDALYNQDQANE